MQGDFFSKVSLKLDPCQQEGLGGWLCYVINNARSVKAMQFCRIKCDDFSSPEPKAV